MLYLTYLIQTSIKNDSSFPAAVSLILFNPPWGGKTEGISVDQILQRPARSSLGYGICRVVISINPFDLHNLFLLVWLPKAHDINYKALILGTSQLYQTVVRRL